MEHPKTPKLLELEAQVRAVDDDGDDFPYVKGRSLGVLEGYKLAQADYQPLLEAVQMLVDYDETPEEHKLEYVTTDLIHQVGAALAAIGVA